MNENNDLPGWTVQAKQSLDESAQRLLRRLSLVGTAGFASWVGAPLLDVEIGHAEYLLQQLVAAHLVEATMMEDGEVRFYLHDLVRIYAIERCGEDESTADRLDAMRRLLRCWLFIATTARRRIYGDECDPLRSARSHGRSAQDHVPVQVEADCGGPAGRLRDIIRLGVPPRIDPE